MVVRVKVASCFSLNALVIFFFGLGALRYAVMLVCLSTFVVEVTAVLVFSHWFSSSRLFLVLFLKISFLPSGETLPVVLLESEMEVAGSK